MTESPSQVVANSIRNLTLLAHDNPDVAVRTGLYLSAKIITLTALPFILVLQLSFHEVPKLLRAYIADDAQTIAQAKSSIYLLVTTLFKTPLGVWDQNALVLPLNSPPYQLKAVLDNWEADPNQVEAENRKAARDAIETCFKNRETALILTHYNLSFLPPIFPYLAHLTTLHLSYNKLTVLPDLSPLNCLETLDCGDNPLTTVPSSIVALSALKTLSIYNIGLVSLPDELTQLPQLKTLDVSHNALHDLPEAYLHLSATINLQGNPIPEDTKAHLATTLAQLNANSHATLEFDPQRSESIEHSGIEENGEEVDIASIDHHLEESLSSASPTTEDDSNSTDSDPEDERAEPLPSPPNSLAVSSICSGFSTQRSDQMPPDS